MAGSYLLEELLRAYPERSVSLYATRRPRSRTDNLQPAVVSQVQWHTVDWTDALSVNQLIEAIRPDWVFHLAAQSFVQSSWRAPDATLTNNVIGELNVLNALVRWAPTCRILLAGSSEEYGLVYAHEVPIRETQPLRPLSPYAVSKVTQEYLGLQYWRSYGLPVMVTRAFNHTGPRRGEVFVESSFAQQVARIRMVGHGTIRHGNLDAVRDWTDVRDTVRAYRLLLEYGTPGEVYNVATGQGHSVASVLQRLIELAGIGDYAVMTVDPERMRPSDVPLLIGDATKLRNATGWEPAIPWEQTLHDLYHYWLQRLQEGEAIAFP